VLWTWGLRGCWRLPQTLSLTTKGGGQVRKRGAYLAQLGATLASQRGTPADAFNGVAVDANALGWALAAVSSRCVSPTLAQQARWRWVRDVSQPPPLVPLPSPSSLLLEGG
jgi:hypothetical protein